MRFKSRTSNVTTRSPTSSMNISVPFRYHERLQKRRANSVPSVKSKFGSDVRIELTTWTKRTQVSAPQMRHLIFKFDSFCFSNFPCVASRTYLENRRWGTHFPPFYLALLRSSYLGDTKSLKQLSVFSSSSTDEQTLWSEIPTQHRNAKFAAGFVTQEMVWKYEDMVLAGK